MKNKLNHLNPKKITVFKTDSNYIETIEKDFNIIDWINPYLINEFGRDLILTAIGSLNLTFQDLTTYRTITDLGRNFDYTIKCYPVHHISTTSQKTKIDSGKRGSRNWINYTEYGLTIPSNLIDGDIIQFCLLNNYPILKEFTMLSEEKVQMLPMQTSFVMLKDIPQELKSKTVNELIEMNKPFFIKKTVSAIKCYTPSSGEKLDKYEFYLETKNGSLYIPYLAMKNSDFTLIEERMNSYFKSYYNNNPTELKKTLGLLKSKEAQKLKSFLNQHETISI